MKIIYIEKGRMPTERAYGYQICQMCEEFGRAGNEVELWVPFRDNYIKEDVFTFYDLEKKFKVKYIKCFDILKYRKYLGFLGFYLHSILFLIKALLVKTEKKTIVYTRVPEIVWLFNLKGNITIFEAHNWPTSKIWLYKYLIQKTSKIITITHALKNLYLDSSFSEEKVLVAPDGVNIEKFDIKLSKNECRQKLNLPLSKKIIIYTGHLYEWKGAQILADAAQFLKEDNLVVFVGGIEKDIKRFKESNKDRDNILIAGKKLPKEIPFYLKAADALVLPNSNKRDISRLYTSPMKLFEYMASRRPIVASDLPSIREILNNDNSILVESDNPKSLAKGIKKVLENRESGDKISKQAFLDVQNYTWEIRAKRIINFIKNN